MKHHATIMYLDSQGRQQNVHLIGTKDEIADHVRDMVFNALSGYYYKEIIINPIHPVNVVDLEERRSLSHG